MYSRFNGSPAFERFLSKPVPSYEELKFFVKMHAANRLHFDLRLEYAGMAMSWAIYPGPSMNPYQSRTAIQVEDHFMSSAKSEKTIVEGKGSGFLILWDEGEWLPHPRQRFRDQFRFTLRGKRLKGDFELRLKRLGQYPYWLLWKVADEFASKEEILKQDTSIRTGLTLEGFLRHNFPLKWMKELPENQNSTDRSRNDLILKIRTEILEGKWPWPGTKKKSISHKRLDMQPTLFAI